jgi:hypothetical protein
MDVKSKIVKAPQIYALLYSQISRDLLEKYERFEKIWEVFIENQDIGLKGINVWRDEYIIVDEKKWLIAKIKYGF